MKGLSKRVLHWKFTLSTFVSMGTVDLETREPSAIGEVGGIRRQ